MGTAAVAAEIGRSLNASDVKRGLRELNPQISFDAVENRPSEYDYILHGGDNKQDTRGGVFYNGKFICAMDRGVIPEHTIWDVVPGFVEIRMSDIERYDETKVVYLEIMPSDPFYHEALLKSERGDDNYKKDLDGRVFRYKAVRMGQTRGEAIRVGWRHTFTEILKRKIPGITAGTLSSKFGVRM